MNHQTQQLQSAVVSTISEIFCGDFTDICGVKQAVLHLEAIYFCHSTSCLLEYSGLTVKEQLALYHANGLLPQSTIAFFEEHQRVVMEHWPEEAVFLERPELLYEALLSGELSLARGCIAYRTDKVSRGMAGAYYTSLRFAAQITRKAIDTYLEERTGITGYSFSVDEENERQAINALAGVSFLDYSCGCGDFLIAVLEYFEQYIKHYPLQQLVTQLKGVDVNPIALMICLARVLSGAKQPHMLHAAADHFLVGNPLLHTEQAIPLEDKFSNFALNRLYASNEGIDCYKLGQGPTILLGNPPWEKLRFEERVFFRPLCPEISEIAQKDKRAVKIAELETAWPELAEYYKLVRDDYIRLKKTIPRHPFLKMSLVGELNTYALFAELASHLAGEDGFAAIIVKSALVSSTCYAPCFRFFMAEKRLSEVFLYDNRRKLFPIDSREKFCVLFLAQSEEGAVRVHYGLTEENEILASEPLRVTYPELQAINPETGLLPNVEDAEKFRFLLRAHKALSVFANEFPDCHFGRLVHLTAHARHISTDLSEDRVPIYEGKFMEQYDNRFSTFAGVPKRERYQAKASAVRQPGDAYQIQKPVPESRYFIDRAFWETFLARYDQPYSLCWRSLTSSTNQRTMIASVMPTAPTCQSIQMLQTPSKRNLLLMLALFNSKVFDCFARLKMVGIDLTQSIVRQIPVPPMEAWDQPVSLYGTSCSAADAVMGLEKLLYRNEPALDHLWDGVAELKGVETFCHSARDLKEEIDRIIFRLYNLSDAEERLVRDSFPS